MALTPNMLLFSDLCYCMLIFELDRYNQLYANAHVMLASTQIKCPRVWRTFGVCPTVALTRYLQSSKRMRCSLCCKSWFCFYNVNYEILTVHALCFCINLHHLGLVKLLIRVTAHQLTQNTLTRNFGTVKMT